MPSPMPSPLPSPMNDTITKIVVGNVFRTMLSVFITFLVTKSVITADVHDHLMRGDTVNLWHGIVPVNFTMILNVSVGLAVPIIVPIAWGMWLRTVRAYKVIVTRAEAFGGATPHEVDEKMSQVTAISALANPGEVISTVATGEAPK